MDYFFALLIGLCIGSFLNVCIFRIPREESISFPPSHCMTCGYKLKYRDNIPVLSYIFLKGKCRSCGEKISIQYPLIELLNGILYLLVYMKYGISINTLQYMALVSFMIVIGIIDFKTKFVFTSTTITTGIFGVIFCIVNGILNKKIPLNNIYGMLLGAILIGLIVFITHGMGEGDIEIAAVSGLMLGFKACIFMLFTAFIIGGIGGVIVLIRRKKGLKDEMPFGPCLAIGTILALFFGNTIISAYLNFCLN